MDETTTRIKKINPRLLKEGWDSVPQSVILYEQRAYEIAPGRLAKGAPKHPKKADYILEYRGKKLAVIEAKSDEKDVSAGVDQAKEYARMLQIRFTYSTNGDDIWFVDMGVKDRKGNYIVPSTEKEVDRFPTPQELWLMTYPEENTWRDKFNLEPLNRGAGREPRYYQEIAINNVLNTVADKQSRILLTMATGTGKTYTAFQICWKLTRTKWNIKGTGKEPRILFIADRNILANQAINDFGQFDEDAMCRITPKELRKNGYKVPTARNLYFTIFQTMMTSPSEQKAEDKKMGDRCLVMGDGGKVTGDGIKVTGDKAKEPYYMQYPRDFFDFIIIDECHRGGANDESEWRRLMEYFDYAYQLGMTATPRRQENANTYSYFGDPVYSYSLKQGIEDGFLVPFRVDIATSNIDDYKYRFGDKVTSGDIDKEKVYTESDFARGYIKIKERDEHRVKEFLSKIGADEKTIVFCATQEHAMIVRDMINKHKTCPDSNYCQRVTANDGEEGEKILRAFQDNEKLRPTILTTSQKLSTGVDARNVRHIVLMRPVNNMVEFKQIIGRGTRLFDDKYYFTIHDFVGAHERFRDADWDGDPFCPVCGNYPCTCNKRGPQPPKECPVCGQQPCVCENDPNNMKKPCPVCGHLPCTCDGGNGSKVIVKLSDYRKLNLYTNWTETVFYDDRLVTLKDFVQILFGKMPTFFSGAEDLRKQWEHPETRENLLGVLEQSGFGETKLEMVKKMLKMEKCDLLDVLENIAYESTPIERAERVKIVQQQWLKQFSVAQQEFDNLILQYYAANGFKELGMDKLKTFVMIKYKSVADAKTSLGWNAKEMREHYIELQQMIYSLPLQGYSMPDYGIGMAAEPVGPE